MKPLQATTIIAIAVGVGGLACQREADETGAAAHTQAEERLDMVTDEPERFYGKHVKFIGEVDESFGSRAFIVEETDLVFDDEVLVVTKSPVTLGQRAPRDEDEVFVTGTVRRWDVGELEKELGWKLPPELADEYDEGPVVVANRIRGLDEYALWSEGEAPKMVGVWAVFRAPHPLDLAGSSIELDGVRVHARGPAGMWLGESHNDMLFVATPANFQGDRIQVGDFVDVSGTLRAMPPADEAIERFGFAQTMSDIVADQVLYVDAKQIDEKQPAKGRETALADFSADRERYLGSSVSGEVTVTDVISDRGFWIEDAKGQKHFVVIREQVAGQELIDINPGQRLALTATVLPSDRIDDVMGRLEPDAKQAIQAEPTFLLTHWAYVVILETA